MARRRDGAERSEPTARGGRHCPPVPLISLPVPAQPPACLPPGTGLPSGRICGRSVRHRGRAVMDPGRCNRPEAAARGRSGGGPGGQLRCRCDPSAASYPHQPAFAGARRSRGPPSAFPAIGAERRQPSPPSAPIPGSRRSFHRLVAVESGAALGARDKVSRRSQGADHCRLGRARKGGFFQQARLGGITQ